MPVTTSPTRSMYSSYIISRSASRIRCRMTCFAVCAAMRPKLSGVTSSRFIWSAGTSDQSISSSSSVSSVWFFSPVSSSIRSCLVPFIDQIGPHDRLVRNVHRFAVRGDLHGPLAGLDDLTPGAAGLGLHTDRLADGVREVVAGAERPLEPRRRNLDAVLVEVA